MLAPLRQSDAGDIEVKLAPGDVAVTIALGSMPTAKSAGTAATPLDTSRERIEPGASSGRASGAPTFDVLATNSRVRSRMRPGCVNGANAAANGPPFVKHAALRDGPRARNPGGDDRRRQRQPRRAG